MWPKTQFQNAETNSEGHNNLIQNTTKAHFQNAAVKNRSIENTKTQFQNAAKRYANHSNRFQNATSMQAKIKPAFPAPKSSSARRIERERERERETGGKNDVVDPQKHRLVPDPGNQ